MLNFQRKFAGQPVIKEAFIECGSYLGGTLIEASKYFNVCHGIEIVPDIYKDALKRIQLVRNYKEKITLHLGNSVDILPQIVDCSTETTFYLDSHFMAANSNTDAVKKLAGTECPLLEEIRFIADLEWSVPHMIIIDDWLMFSETFWKVDKKSASYNRDDWPSEKEIFGILNEYEYTNSGKRAIFVSRDLNMRV